MYFTPTQQQIIDILADGMPHTLAEIHEKMHGDGCTRGTLHVSVCILRKILRPQGQDIICEFRQRKYHYRHIRLLASAYDGKK